MSTHFKEQCKHGIVVNQCHCASSNKTVSIIPCPDSCMMNKVAAPVPSGLEPMHKIISRNLMLEYQHKFHGVEMPYDALKFFEDITTVLLEHFRVEFKEEY